MFIQWTNKGRLHYRSELFSFGDRKRNLLCKKLITFIFQILIMKMFSRRFYYNCMLLNLTEIYLQYVKYVLNIQSNIEVTRIMLSTYFGKIPLILAHQGKELT